MYRLGQCTLVYVHHTEDENYNPKVETLEVVAKCQLMDSFSFNYYQSQTRDMRNSKNIIVSKNRAFDVYENDKRYQLEYVFFGSLKYKLINVLRNKNSDLTMILDCQEVMNE